MKKSDEVNLLKKEFDEWGLNEDSNEESPEQDLTVEDGNSLPGISQELTEVNRELLGYIEYLESGPAQTKDTPAISERPPAPELDWKYTDAVSEQFQQDSNLLSVIKNFEEEIDATMTLENVLRANVQEVREKILRETAAKTTLESKASLLESQAALVDDLRKEIQPTEEDRDRISKSFDETQVELKSVTVECNVLTEKLSAVQEKNRWIQGKKSDLQAQESTLNDKTEDMGGLRQELSQTKSERDLLDERAHEFKRRLETTNNSVETMKSDLETSRNTTHTMRAKIEKDQAQIEDLRKQSAVVNTDLSDVRAKIDSQVKSNRQLEAQVKALTRNCEVANKELGSARGALGRFHRAAIKFHQQTREVLSRPYPRA